MFGRDRDDGSVLNNGSELKLTRPGFKRWPCHSGVSRVLLPSSVGVTGAPFRECHWGHGRTEGGVGSEFQ